MTRALACGVLFALAAAAPLKAASLYDSLPAAPIPASLPAPASLDGPRASLLTPWSGEHWAVAALEPAQSGRLSCLWYSGAEAAALTHAWLPVQRGCALWLTARQDPPGGALRLALWPAGGGDLGAYALSTLPEGAAAPLADYWLGLDGLRATPTGGRLALPWDPPQSWREDAPRGFEFAPWPLAQAWLDSGLSPRLKDCGLGGLAGTTLVIDAGGARGAWQPGLGRELELYFVLPPGLAYHRAAALIAAQPGTGFGLAETRLSLAVNNLPAEEMALQPALYPAAWPEWQQVRFDLSQRLQAGLNYLAAGAPLVSAGECRIASLQVWVQ